MKYFLFLLLLTTLEARENPFEPVYNVPQVKEGFIPLLDIATHQAYKSPKEVNHPKKISTTLQTVIPIPAKVRPIVQTTAIVESTPCEIKPKKITKKVTKRVTKKRLKQHKKILFRNYFLKLLRDGQSLKIFTDDRLLRRKEFTDPKRVALDFQRLQYFRTKTVHLQHTAVEKIKFGSHHKFYRITLKLKYKKHLKITPTSYGYLLTF